MEKKEGNKTMPHYLAKKINDRLGILLKTPKTKKKFKNPSRKSQSQKQKNQSKIPKKFLRLNQKKNFQSPTQIPQVSEDNKKTKEAKESNIY